MMVEGFKLHVLYLVRYDMVVVGSLHVHDLLIKLYLSRGDVNTSFRRYRIMIRIHK